MALIPDPFAEARAALVRQFQTAAARVAAIIAEPTTTTNPQWSGFTDEFERMRKIVQTACQLNDAMRIAELAVKEADHG